MGLSKGILTSEASLEDADGKETTTGFVCISWTQHVAGRVRQSGRSWGLVVATETLCPVSTEQPASYTLFALQYLQELTIPQ